MSVPADEVVYGNAEQVCDVDDRARHLDMKYVVFLLERSDRYLSAQVRFAFMMSAWDGVGSPDVRLCRRTPYELLR
jgi:hypothetical protein